MGHGIISSNFKKKKASVTPEGVLVYPVLNGLIAIKSKIGSREVLFAHGNSKRAEIPLGNKLLIESELKGDAADFACEDSIVIDGFMEWDGDADMEEVETEDYHVWPENAATLTRRLGLDKLPAEFEDALKFSVKHIDIRNEFPCDDGKAFEQLCRWLFDMKPKKKKEEDCGGGSLSKRDEEAQEEE